MKKKKQIPKCQSCGVPTPKSRRRGRYCIDCIDEKGNLKRRKEIKKDLIVHFLKTGKSKTKGNASRMADAYLNRQPAWKKKRLIHKKHIKTPPSITRGR